jgi:hypothetical protein
VSKVASKVILALCAASIGAAAAAASSSSVRESTERAFIAAAAAGKAHAPCRDTIGKDAALALVRYCRNVSSATHPPCNTGNACALIVQHIRGMCHAGEAKTLPCGDLIKPSGWERIRRLPAQ